jgi:hypothetical protein
VIKIRFRNLRRQDPKSPCFQGHDLRRRSAYRVAFAIERVKGPTRRKGANQRAREQRGTVEIERLGQGMVLQQRRCWSATPQWATPGRITSFIVEAAETTAISARYSSDHPYM